MGCNVFVIEYLKCIWECKSRENESTNRVLKVNES